MRVDDIMDFGRYWNDRRFRQKRPRHDKDVRTRCGDNIYEQLPDGGSRQLPSMHSDGQNEHPANKERDLAGKNVLVSEAFAYFDRSRLPCPPHSNFSSQEEVIGAISPTMRKLNSANLLTSRNLASTHPLGSGRRMTTRGRAQPVGSDESHLEPQGIRLVCWQEAEPDLPGRHDDFASDSRQIIDHRLQGHCREWHCVNRRTGS
jgi:hypothetical protein